MKFDCFFILNFRYLLTILTRTLRQGSTGFCINQTRRIQDGYEGDTTQGGRNIQTNSSDNDTPVFGA